MADECMVCKRRFKEISWDYSHTFSLHSIKTGKLLERVSLEICDDCFRILKRGGDCMERQVFLNLFKTIRDDNITVRS